MAQCDATTRTGDPCGAQALLNSAFCYMHDPTRAAERTEARRRGGHNRRTARSLPVPEEVSLDDCRSFREVLERVVVDTLALENSARRSRTVGYLIGIALKLHEVAEIEERLRALEERLCT